MDSNNKTKITIKTDVKANVEKVWNVWNEPAHVIKWNSASDDWHTPKAENDLREGGRFNYRMEAKDGSFGFDFYAIYDQVKPNELLRYTLEDGRKVEVNFKSNGDTTEITEVFEAEDANPVEMQQTGWQSILNNFKKYVESFG